MKKSEKQAVSEFVRIIGGTTWELSRKICTGKWTGTIDYGIVVDGNHYLFVSNGMENFEGRVRDWIRSVNTFIEKNGEYMRIIREQIKKDNLLSDKEGLKDVCLVDIGMVSPEAKGWGEYFRPYVLLEVDGKRFKHSETGFAYAIIQDKLDKVIEISNNRNCYTAGAVKDPDYILFNVRFSSKDNLYKIV